MSLLGKEKNINELESYTSIFTQLDTNQVNINRHRSLEEHRVAAEEQALQNFKREWNDILGSVDISYPAPLRPVTCSQNPKILVNVKSDCFDSDPTGSREQVTGRRDMKCQQTLEWDSESEDDMAEKFEQKALKERQKQMSQLQRHAIEQKLAPVLERQIHQQECLHFEQQVLLQQENATPANTNKHLIKLIKQEKDGMDVAAKWPTPSPQTICSLFAFSPIPGDEGTPNASTNATLSPM